MLRDICGCGEAINVSLNLKIVLTVLASCISLCYFCCLFWSPGSVHGWKSQAVTFLSVTVRREKLQYVV